MFVYDAKWIPQFSGCIQPLIKTKQFLLDAKACAAFYHLKQLLMNPAQHCPDNTKPYMIDCDASDVAVSATLKQLGRPAVAFISWTLNRHDTHSAAIEKEATAVIEAVRNMFHFLFVQHFTIVTDQKSMAFMMDNRRRSKIKYDKIQGWHLELANISYDIPSYPRRYNVVVDTLSRAYCNASFALSNKKLQNDLCHSGITRLLHYVRSKICSYPQRKWRKPFHLVKFVPN